LLGDVGVPISFAPPIDLGSMPNPMNPLWRLRLARPNDMAETDVAVNQPMWPTIAAHLQR
jgi:hypothetical protein